MRRSELDRIVDEVRGYYETDSTCLWPTEMHYPSKTYVDPEHARREREVMQRFPIIVGHGSRIPGPGDFLTDDTTGKPLLIVRQDDGSVRAFLNICRHRGARLCDEASGRSRQFVCPYHAWTYRSDGSLRAIPRSEGFSGIEQGGSGLFEMPVEERHGLLWVVPVYGASIDVAAYLGPLDEEIASYGISDMVLERDELLTFDINWKYVIDGFCEVYHFARLHRNSIAPHVHGTHSPYEAFGRHGRMVVVRRTFDPIAARGADGMSREEVLSTLAMTYQLFPNSVIVWQGDHFECWTSYPGATPDKCTIRIQSITTPEQASDAMKPRWDRNWEIMIRTVVTEDWAVSRTIQDSIPSLPDGTIVFGRNEPGMQHFHGQILKECGQSG
ncbi:MAG: aromatic ring-hydroxylating dioxygenase subunit alpha [Pseudomonadota bacterium]|nr:aromatic ring-hydroxylating dioxygenase subunit alpha [Pseudomonadota bacterium]